MDPDAAWATILDPKSSHQQRADAALALLAWLASEGFLPHTDVGRAGVVEVCKAAVEIAFDDISASTKERSPMTGIPYLRLLDLRNRAIYFVEAPAAFIAVWNGQRFVYKVGDRLTDHWTPGDGVTKGQIKALEACGTLPDRIETRIANNRPLFTYLTSLEQSHGSEPGGMDVHPR